MINKHVTNRRWVGLGWLGFKSYNHPAHILQAIWQSPSMYVCIMLYLTVQAYGIGIECCEVSTWNVHNICIVTCLIWHDKDTMQSACISISQCQYQSVAGQCLQCCWCYVVLCKHVQLNSYHESGTVAHTRMTMLGWFFLKLGPLTSAAWCSLTTNPLTRRKIHDHKVARQASKNDVPHKNQVHMQSSLKTS